MACQSFVPIYWNKGDVDNTIAQVKEHNAAWKAICAAKAKQSYTNPAKIVQSASFKDRWFGGEKLQVTAFR